MIGILMNKILITVVLSFVGIFATTNVQAGTFNVFSPLVEAGEIGFELRYGNVLNAEPLEEGATSMAFAVEWGINEDWRLEFVSEYETPDEDSEKSIL